MSQLIVMYITIYSNIHEIVQIYALLLKISDNSVMVWDEFWRLLFIIMSNNHVESLRNTCVNIFYNNLIRYNTEFVLNDDFVHALEGSWKITNHLPNQLVRPRGHILIFFLGAVKTARVIIAGNKSVVGL